MFSPKNYTLALILLAQTLVVGILTLYLFYTNSNLTLSAIVLIQILVTLSYGTSIFSIRKIFILQQQDTELHKQSKYLENMEELIQNIRSQRHDFLNHLQTVYGLLQMGKFERAQNYISTIATDARNYSQLIQLKNPEISALLQQKTGQALERNIAFEIMVQTDLSDISIRPFLINRILGNLIDNAFDAVMNLSPEKRKIWLNFMEDNDFLVLAITNTGPGIESNLLEKIFEHGFSTKGTGRGLGLSIVKQTIEQHQGRITVTSPPTTFRIMLPRKGPLFNGS